MKLKELATDLRTISDKGNQKTIKWFKSIVKDTEIKAYSPSMIMDKTRSYGIVISKGDKKKIKNLLKPLEFNQFGGLFHYRISGDDFLIWLFGTIRKFQDSRGQDPRFAGTLKIHKLVYFIKNYKLRGLFDFQFQRYPYGVFSEELRRLIETFEDMDLIYSTERENLWNEDRLAKKYSLTPRGEGRFTEIETNLSSIMDDNEYEGVMELCHYLYDFSSNLLGKASKYHFTRSDWEPFLLWLAEDLMEDIITSAPSHVVKESLKKEMIYYFKSEIHNTLLLRTISDDPIDPMEGDTLTKFLRMATIGDVFLHDEYFIFGRDDTPTNYVFPVELYRRIDAIKEHLATEIMSNIPPTSRAIVFLYDGLCWEIAKLIAKRDLRIKLYGPVFDRTTGKPFIPHIKEQNVTILTDTIFTGQTLLGCIDYLKKKNKKVQKVLSFADRECGLSQKLHEADIEFYSILDKEKLARILMSKLRMQGD